MSYIQDESNSVYQNTLAIKIVVFLICLILAYSKQLNKPFYRKTI